jgi:hypothetical protein
VPRTSRTSCRRAGARELAARGEVVVSATCRRSRRLGPEQSWEEPNRCRARRVRDRFDRELLLRHFQRLGLAPGDPAFYGEGVLVETHSWFEPRTTPIADDDQRRL